MPAETHSDEPLHPPEIGGYRILRVLGEGGMATVYAALQQRPRRTVALKVMQPAASPSALRRFRREAELLGRLQHPGIAQVYEAGTYETPQGERPYLVMEYIPRAQTILEHVARQQLDLRARVRLFVKICAAVDHGHRRKVIHRDLKPANVLIDAGGSPKVIDFGIARSLEPGAAAEQTAISEHGRIVGTIQYLSPEQLDPGPRDLDARSDVYALGVLLYKMLTGHMSHEVEGLPVYRAIAAIRGEPPQPPSAHRSELRGDLEAIILKALEKDPRDRYADAGAMGRDAVRWLERRPIKGRRSGAVRRAMLLARRHRPVVAAAAIVAVVMAVAIALVVAAQRRAAPVDTAPAPPGQRPASALEQAAEALEGAAAGGAAAIEPFDVREQVGAVRALAFDGSGALLASGADDHSTAVWDVAEQGLLHMVLEHEAPVTHLAFSGELLVSGEAARGMVLILDGRSGRVRMQRRFDAPPLRALAVHSGSERLAVSLSDLTLRIMPIAEEGPATVLRSSSGVLEVVAFDDDGDRIAAASAGGHVYVWELPTGRRLQRLEGLDAPAVAIGFTARERIVVITSSGVGSWWLPDGTRGDFAASIADVTAAVFDRSGQWLLTGDDRRVRLWDLRGEDPVLAGDQPAPDGVRSLGFAPGEPVRCAIGGVDGTVHVVGF